MINRPYSQNGAVLDFSQQKESPATTGVIPRMPTEAPLDLSVSHQSSYPTPRAHHKKSSSSSLPPRRRLDDDQPPNKVPKWAMEGGPNIKSHRATWNGHGGGDMTVKALEKMCELSRVSSENSKGNAATSPGGAPGERRSGKYQGFYICFQ